MATKIVSLIQQPGKLYLGNNPRKKKAKIYQFQDSRKNLNI